MAFPKRVFAVVLILCLLPVTAFAREEALYTDVSPSDWYWEPVTYVTERSLMQGDGTGRFLPEQVMTRGMVVTLLHRLAGLPSSDPQGGFPDVRDSHYAAKAARWACETGISSGDLSGRFLPNDPITREQAVVFLYRCAGVMKLRPISGRRLRFSDAAQISAYAEPAVSWAVTVGILQDTEDAMNPQAHATRAEIAAMVMRFQLWAEQRGAAALLPGEPVAYLGQIVRAVRSDGILYLPDRSGEAADNAHVRYFEGTRYISLEHFETSTAYAAGTTPDGMRYVAKHEPLMLPEAGLDVPILMYHAVSDDVWGMEELFVGPDILERQLVYLKASGYDPIWFEDLAHLSRYDKPVILTFDDGYLDNYTNLYPLLQKYGIKATFFVIGESIGWENKMNRAQLYELSRSGLVSVQSHTYSHAPLDTLTAEQQAYEMQAGQAMVASVTGKVSRVLCYPGGRFNGETLRLVRDYYDFALKWDGGLYTTGDDPHQMNRFYVARSTTMEQFRAFLN